MPWTEYIHLLIALVAIVDIPGNLPMFLRCTAHLSMQGRQLTAVTAALATCLILLVFSFFGQAILAGFGVSVAAFKILGGLVILLMALEMVGLIGNSSQEQERTGESAIAVGIFPMAVPLFAGPGAISAVTVFSHAEPAVEHAHVHVFLIHDLVVAAVIITVSSLIWIGLTAATAMSRWLTPLVQDILNRLFGIIVGALGVEFMLEGIAETFPVLGESL